MNVVTRRIARVRVSGNWFVEKFAVSDAVQWTPEGQSLRLEYTDWDNSLSDAWVVRAPDGEYQFTGVAAAVPAVRH